MGGEGGGVVAEKHDVVFLLDVVHLYTVRGGGGGGLKTQKMKPVFFVYTVTPPHRVNVKKISRAEPQRGLGGAPAGIWGRSPLRGSG